MLLLLPGEISIFFHVVSIFDFFKLLLFFCFLSNEGTRQIPERGNLVLTHGLDLHPPFMLYKAVPAHITFCTVSALCILFVGVLLQQRHIIAFNIYPQMFSFFSSTRSKKPNIFQSGPLLSKYILF